MLVLSGGWRVKAFGRFGPLKTATAMRKQTSISGGYTIRLTSPEKS